MYQWNPTSLHLLPQGKIECFSEQDLEEMMINEEAAGKYPWRESDFVSSLSNHDLCLGLRLEKRWVAHAVFSYVLDELELLIITVSKSFQQQGLAKAILIAVIEDAAKQAYRKIHLEVRSSNAAAIRLYKSLGFRQVGLRKNYYIKNVEGDMHKEDALLFAKELSCLE